MTSTMHVTVKLHKKTNLDLAKWAFERIIATAERKPWNKRGTPHLGGAEFLTKLAPILWEKQIHNFRSMGGTNQTPQTER